MRLIPFSHRPGVKMIFPGTFLNVEVFPCMIKIQNHQEIHCFEWSLPGLIDPFTVEQDLDKGQIRIYGMSKIGYFRFILQKQEHSIIFIVDKIPEDSIEIAGKRCVKGDQRVLCFDVSKKSTQSETLFLGMTKQLDFDLIRKRKDLREIFPIWHKLGRLLDPVPLEDLEDLRLLLKEDLTAAQSRFLDYYLAGFSSGFAPRLQDEEHQGFFDVKIPNHLLEQGSFLISSLFFYEDSCYHILPYLLPKFVSGSFSTVTQSGVSLEIFWSKKIVRMMKVSSPNSCQIFWKFPKEIKSYRVRRSLREKGKCCNVSDPFEILGGESLILDRFQR